MFVGDNGPWHWCLVEEVAPAFEKQTGIKVDFTLLPIDALNARLKSELNSGSSGIDIIQWTSQQIGWLVPAPGGPREAAGGRGGQASPTSTGTISFRRSARWRSRTASCPAFRIA